MLKRTSFAVLAALWIALSALAPLAGDGGASPDSKATPASHQHGHAGDVDHHDDLDHEDNCGATHFCCCPLPLEMAALPMEPAAAIVAMPVTGDSGVSLAPEPAPPRQHS